MSARSAWRTVAGVLLGVLAAAALLALAGGGRQSADLRGEPLPGALLSDCDGPLRDVVIHYVPGAAPVVAVTYREFLRQLPPTTTVHVLTPDAPAFADFAERVGSVPCRLEAVPVGHPLTAWSRDRWLAAAARSRVTLVTPAAENGAEAWPARQGDGRTAADLAARFPAWVATERTGLFFDGGDFVTDGRTLFVSPQLIERNVGLTVATSEALAARLERLFGLPVVLLAGGPRHHAGMVLMAAGDRRVVVGDPAAATALYAAAGQPLPAWADTSPAAQASFDAVADHCRRAGYAVHRLPCVAGRDGRTFLTYANVIIDGTPNRRIVYMPVYSDADALNAAAERTWRGLGFEVRRIDCSAVYPHAGSLRCLVNVLRRGPA